MAWMEYGVHHPQGMKLQARPVQHTEAPRPPVAKPTEALGLFDEVRNRLLLVLTDPDHVRIHAETARTHLTQRGRPVTSDPDTAMLAMLYNQRVGRTLAA